MRKYNHVKLNIEGVNLKRLIKNLYKNKIDIYDLNFNSPKNLVITINQKDYKKSKTYLKEYRVSVIKRYGINNIFNFGLVHIGLLIGLFFFFVIIFLNNNFLSTIYITGNSRISNAQIINFLGQKKIKQYTFFNNINVEKLESELENNFNDISLVSVIKKGTNLIINIKEKLNVDEILTSSDIISDVNGQIIELNIIQGYTKFKVGDSVKVGDILVNGYDFNGENKVKCKALAYIKMKVWYSSSYTFLDEELVLERTGKVITNTYYNIFNKMLPMKVKKINFVKYEKETKTQYLFNNFLVPIKIYSEKFYEIKENLVKNDFSLQKNDIIDKTIREAKKNIKDESSIQNITTEIQDTTNGKIVTSYVEMLWEYN